MIQASDCITESLPYTRWRYIKVPLCKYPEYLQKAHTMGKSPLQNSFVPYLASICCKPIRFDCFLSLVSFLSPTKGLFQRIVINNMFRDVAVSGAHFFKSYKLLVNQNGLPIVHVSDHSYNYIAVAVLNYMLILLTGQNKNKVLQGLYKEYLIS